MGYRHYFVADRLEEVVDEGDSRSSSRVHEKRAFSACFTTACDNPDTLKSMSISSRRTSVHQRVAPFYLDLHLRLCLCLCLSLNVQQTYWYSRSQERNVYRFHEHSNGTFVLSQQGCQISCDDNTAGCRGWSDAGDCGSETCFGSSSNSRSRRSLSTVDGIT